MLYKLTTSALAVEIGSLLILLTNSKNLLVLGCYFILHALGSALLAMAAIRFLPQSYRHPRQWVIAYFFIFNFFMPVAGLLFVLVGAGCALWWPRSKQAAEFDTIQAPRFTTHRNHEGTGFRGGQVRAQLGNTEAPGSLRLKALVAVQDTPVRVTGSLLRDMLADPADDIRLLAYGILDNKEKQVTQRIVEYRRQLDVTVDPMERQDLHKRLAELYWELIYQNLVRGDMQSFAAEQVRTYTQYALEQDCRDAGLWFRLLKLELFVGQVDAAEYALQQAQANGFVRERLLPYLAELRFLQRRFKEVRGLFAELKGQPGVPALGPARQYWMQNAG